ncbi:S1 family peptidase [Streptomyces scabiei]|uniref:S1 family peptidase n=1 Tax=Streptomyces scabiei TaxID=1930 RepID=UPI0038F80684
MTERDYNMLFNIVVPVMRVRATSDDTVRNEGFAGTAFMLKHAKGQAEGVAVTARHVAEQLTPGEAAVLFRGTDGSWQPAAVQGIESHPTQDVALLRLEPGTYVAHCVLSRREEHASLQYMLWGYPAAVLYESVSDDGIALQRPDLIYSEGHVRRRISDRLPGIHGSRFFELSTPAGPGCSGAPIVARSQGHLGGSDWQVVGVYVGERRSQPGDLFVGYGVRIADIDQDAESWSALFA